MDVKTSNFRRVPALPIYGCAQPSSQVRYNLYTWRRQCQLIINHGGISDTHIIYTVMLVLVLGLEGQVLVNITAYT